MPSGKCRPYCLGLNVLMGCEISNPRNLQPTEFIGIDDAQMNY